MRLQALFLVLVTSQTSTSGDLGATGSAMATTAEQVKCRSRGLMLGRQAFLEETCAMCYIYIPPNQFKTGSAKWTLAKKWTVIPSGSRLSNGSVEVRDGYLNGDRAGF